MTDRLQAGQQLMRLQSLTSANGRFTLIAQPDGNLVLYHDDIAATNAYWSTGTWNLRDDQRPTVAAMQFDANFVLYDAGGVARWATATWGPAFVNPQIVLQDDGNLVVYDEMLKPVWAAGNEHGVGRIPSLGFVDKAGGSMKPAAKPEDPKPKLRPGQGGAVHIEDVLLNALAQKGDKYVFGIEADAANPDPDAFDCSELVEWACDRAGVKPKMPDGSWIQWQHCRNNDCLIPVNVALGMRGALLFLFKDGDPAGKDRPGKAHVAWSLGDGTTIEARSPKWGVGTFPAAGLGFTHAGVVPGADYSKRLA